MTVPSRREIAFIAWTTLVVAGPMAAAPRENLAADRAGVALEMPANLLVALPIVNRGPTPISEIRIDAIRLENATLVEPASLPDRIGSLSPRGKIVFEASFSTRRFAPSSSHRLTVQGAYSDRGRLRRFVFSQSIRVPPRAPGEASLRTLQVASRTVRGAPFRHRDVHVAPEANRPGPPVPTGKRRGDLKPTTTATTVQPGNKYVPAIGGRPSQDRGVSRAGAEKTDSNDLVFVLNTPFGTTGGLPNDPSGASGGFGFNGPRVVLATGNTYASLSVTEGTTFAQLDPTTIFPNDDAAGNVLDGGLCCDQVVHYSPIVNRFFWLMQFWSGRNGQNRLRLASASPEDVVASGGTLWTYWDLTSADFNLGMNMMDYPDLSVGNNFLYLSVDAGVGLLVARIPLTELRDGGTIHIGYTAPNDNSTYGVHLIQSPGDEIFWAGHPTNSRLRVFSLKEGSNTYFWRDVDIDSYPNKDFTSKSPDGSDWLASLFSGGPGGIRLAGGGTDEIWFEWMGARGGDFPHPQVQVVRIRHSDFSVIQQTQIWNDSFAFGYASFTSGNFRVGVSLAYGGGAFYGTPAVGIMGDGVVYQPCSSTANGDRYGDYATVRQASPNGALFSAAGYCVSAGPTFDPHYVLFGRSADVNPAPIALNRK